jgi:hypothetical protein
LRDQGREHREIAATEKAASELKAAQYYINATLGDAANAYALDNLGAVTAHLIQQDTHRKRFWPMASKSICHPETRLWIHQGHWLRFAKRTDRLLHVSGWQHHGQTDCKKVTNDSARPTRTCVVGPSGVKTKRAKAAASPKRKPCIAAPVAKLRTCQ